MKSSDSTERLRIHLAKCEGQTTYQDAMRAAYPDPKSWNYSSNGGPPGCAMAFGNLIRRIGGQYSSFRNYISVPRKFYESEDSND